MNIHKFNTKVNKELRKTHKGHNPFVLWFTGLSGSGKSTLANEVEKYLYAQGHHTYLLDGDNLRTGINNNLGFSKEDREENIRRVAEISKLFIDAGIITLVSVISPFRKDREFAKSLFEPNEFIEVYVKCSLETCENRDAKGLYKKARDGVIKEFTGITSPYEEPKLPDILIDTDKYDIESSLEKLLNFLKEKILL